MDKKSSKPAMTNHSPASLPSHDSLPRCVPCVLWPSPEDIQHGQGSHGPWPSEMLEKHLDFSGESLEVDRISQEFHGKFMGFKKSGCFRGIIWKLIGRISREFPGISWDLVENGCSQNWGVYPAKSGLPPQEMAGHHGSKHRKSSISSYFTNVQWIWGVFDRMWYISMRSN